VPISSYQLIPNSITWLRFAALSTILLAHPAMAAVWTGYDVAFTKAAYADPTDPANQDAITAAVALTRANNQGIYNAVSEVSFLRSASPVDTEWAFAAGNPSEELSATNYAALVFGVWATANAGNPPSTVGQNAVLHLISEDIYMDIRFTDWGSSNSGGSFAYLRSAAPIPEPSTALLVGLGLIGLGSRSRLRP